MTTDFVWSMLFCLWFFIICVSALCSSKRSDQQEALPRSNPRVGTTPAAFQPQFVDITDLRPHQNNVRVGTPIAMHQSTHTFSLPHEVWQSNNRAGISHAAHQLQFVEIQFMSSIPRNYGLLHIPSQAHTFRNTRLLSRITRSSQMITPMPRESPGSRGPSAFVLTPTIVTDKDAECTICLGNLQGEDTVVLMPYCTHLFHEKCIQRWLLYQPSCPLCRVPADASRRDLFSV
jgi:Ring finger domain